MPDIVAVYTTAVPGLGRLQCLVLLARLYWEDCSALCYWHAFTGKTAVPCVIGTPLLGSTGIVSLNG